MPALEQCSNREQLCGCPRELQIQRVARTLLPGLCSPLFSLLNVQNGAARQWDGCLRRRLPDSPDRTASGLRSGANWSSQSSHHGRRQSYRHEQIGRIDIVLAGLVDDSNVSLTRSFTVGEDLIELSGFQIFHPTVLYTQRERRRWLLNPHDVQSKKRLTFRPRLPTP